MNPASPISAQTTRQRDSRMRVSNLTRGTVLATHLEVADTGKKRSKGLLGRKGLAEGGGLWIVPCESVHTFFMQFPIDLVYLDRKLRVRKVRESVGPWRLSACLSAHSILELPAGTIRSYANPSQETCWNWFQPPIGCRLPLCEDGMPSAPFIRSFIANGRRPRPLHLRPVPEPSRQQIPGQPHRRSPQIEGRRQLDSPNQPDLHRQAGQRKKRQQDRGTASDTLRAAGPEWPPPGRIPSNRAQQEWTPASAGSSPSASPRCGAASRNRPVPSRSPGNRQQVLKNYGLRD